MSRDDTGTIKAGMAIVISSGCYSDYSFGQVYIALKDFNYMEEGKKFFFAECDKELAKEGANYHYTLVEAEQFEQYLISNGFLGLCDYREIFVGGSGFLDDNEWEDEWRKLHNLERNND